MAAPRQHIVQVNYENPQATAPLQIPVMVVCNTPDEELENNIRINTAREELPWLREHPENSQVAIMVGGGPSAADHIDQIRKLQIEGGVIFAMNAASQWLRRNGIEADYQCILDAKQESSILVDQDASAHIIASQVHPDTMEAAPRATVWHLELGHIESLFPQERRKRGDYCLCGGGSSVGNSAMAVAFTLGHRDFHVFGYDCSHREKKSHAYPQDMNTLLPTSTIEWAGKKYLISMSMRGQTTAFPVMARELKKNGCTIEMYGDGLLQHIYRTKPEDMTEIDKYRSMWNFSEYRDLSPGFEVLSTFLEAAKPDGLILDLGCGTGRASVELHKQGYKVYLIDFADNCRDQEALELPFMEHDLTEPLNMFAPWGFCSDVMEHIPPDDVDTVINNIMASAKKTFFQISTVPDLFGEAIGFRLHLTVKSHSWWNAAFKRLGYQISWEQARANASCFIVTTSQKGQ